MSDFDNRVSELEARAEVIETRLAGAKQALKTAMDRRLEGVDTKLAKAEEAIGRLEQAIRDLNAGAPTA